MLTEKQLTKERLTLEQQLDSAKAKLKQAEDDVRFIQRRLAINLEQSGMKETEMPVEIVQEITAKAFGK